MAKVVSDASIVVKWFIDEKYSDRALKLRDMHVNGEVSIAAPELLPFEVLNALKSSNFFSTEELKMAAASLLNYRLELYPLSQELAERTIEIAMKSSITVYDASYIALAVKLGSVLYTSDKEIIKRVDKEYKRYVLHISEVTY